MDDSKLYENRGLNVTFKAHGDLREMLDYAHKEYGVNKSEQAQYLMETLIATELTGKNQIDDYLRIIKGLIIRKLKAKQALKMENILHLLNMVDLHFGSIAIFRH